MECYITRIVVILLTLLFIPFVLADNSTMVIEVDIIADESIEDSISIEVPDSLYMGEINEGEATEKFQVFINNTGNVNVTITPELVEPADEIFDNLFFQNRKTGNNSEVFQIGDYSFSIAKPGTSGKRNEYFWMWLDLEDYDEDIEEDMLGEKADIRFVALPEI